MSSRIKIAKEYYSAFARGDRHFIEEHLADDFGVPTSSCTCSRQPTSAWMLLGLGRLDAL
jgi:hypothetical protein